jgi:hypothetical protein
MMHDDCGGVEHPELASERRSELELFDELVRQTRHVGEIGLDGTTSFKRFWRDQTYVFEHGKRPDSSASWRSYRRSPKPKATLGRRPLAICWVSLRSRIFNIRISWAETQLDSAETGLVEPF